MHLQINANGFIQTGTTAGQLGSRFFDAKLLSNLVLTPDREANFEPYTGPFSFELQRHGMSSQDVCSACLTIHTVGITRQTSDAPRPETPCHMGSGTVVSHNATRPCQEISRRPLRGVARPWQLRHRGRCHACSRVWPQTGRLCCAPVLVRGATMC